MLRGWKLVQRFIFYLSSTQCKKGHPLFFFFFFVQRRMRFLILGQSFGLKKKKTKKNHKTSWNRRPWYPRTAVRELFQVKMVLRHYFLWGGGGNAINLGRLDDAKRTEKKRMAQEFVKPRFFDFAINFVDDTVKTINIVIPLPSPGQACLQLDHCIYTAKSIKKKSLNISLIKDVQDYHRIHAATSHKLQGQ